MDRGGGVGSGKMEWWENGMVERWNGGITCQSPTQEVLTELFYGEKWKDGKMERWKNGKMEKPR